MKGAKFRFLRAVELLFFLAVLPSAACRFVHIGAEPAIAFSVVPVSDQGGPESLEVIQGIASHASPGQRIVLYAYSGGYWWLQPFASRPFTDIKPDSTWQNSVHLGTQYAALLVDRLFKPSSKLEALPAKGNNVFAVAAVPGTPYKPKLLHFSGYDWTVRQISSNRGGKLNPYDPANASVDEAGLLHLKIVRRENKWYCAEIALKQSLGPGTYQFTVRDTSRLDPAAALRMYTWEQFSLFNHELDIDVSRWGNPEAKNAEYVVQPSYEPNNIFRFETPPGNLTFSFHWEPGKVSFRTARTNAATGSRPLAERVFTSGVPAPGGESIHISLYAYGNSHIPMQEPAEVIIERFQYAP